MPAERVRPAAAGDYNPARVAGIPLTALRRVRAIDIMFFVERLEATVASGKKLPLTANVVIDQAATLDLIDELRHSIPEEVQSAKRINAESDRIVERAQEEAERIVGRAQEQAALLIEERELTRAAQEEGRRIVAEAVAESEAVRRGADEYAVSVLLGLEREVVRTLQSIKRGIAMLNERGVLTPGADQEEIDAGTEEAAQAPLRA